MISLPSIFIDDAEACRSCGGRGSAGAVCEIGNDDGAASLRSVAQSAEMVFERPGDTVGFHHQHGNAEGFRPAAPVGGDIAEIVGDEQRNAEFRIFVMQFERHGDVTVAVVDGAGCNAFEDAPRQGRWRAEGRWREDLAAGPRRARRWLC